MVQHLNSRWKLFQKGAVWGCNRRASKKVKIAITQKCPKRQPKSKIVVKYANKFRGKGLFAIKKIRKGETILNEQPLVSQQEGEDQLCHNCKKFLVSAEILIRLECKSVAALKKPSDIGVPIPCRMNCGTYFCSVECEKSAFCDYHQVLCSSKNPRMSSFDRYCISHSENYIFYAAARVVASVIVRYMTSKSFSIAWEPYAGVCRAKTWWDGTGETSKKEITDMKIRTFQAVRLLQSGLSRYLDEWTSALVCTENFSSIISMFEKNALAVTIPSPVHQYLDKFPEECNKYSGLDCLSPASGTALYTIQSCANHSCNPNAEIVTDVSQQSAYCHMIAVRDIQIGDEICISYIDHSLSKTERDKDLIGYGFICRCSKCESER